MKCKVRKSQSVFFIILFTFFLLFYQQVTLANESVENTGDDLHLLLLASGLGATLFYEDGYDGTIQFAKSFAVSQIITEGLKSATDKERPNGGCCRSFPSGHSSKAFMSAGFIHKRYGWGYAVPAYIAASYVAYSRVEADKHYEVDVAAGAAIGILSSFYFTEKYKGVEVVPLAGDGVIGLYVSVDW